MVFAVKMAGRAKLVLCLVTPPVDLARRRAARKLSTDAHRPDYCVVWDRSITDTHGAIRAAVHTASDTMCTHTLVRGRVRVAPTCTGVETGKRAVAAVLRYITRLTEWYRIKATKFGAFNGYNFVDRARFRVARALALVSVTLLKNPPSHLVRSFPPTTDDHLSLAPFHGGRLFPFVF